MFKKLAVTAVALMMVGCGSTAKPQTDEPVPYDNKSSLALNVMKQVGAHYKLDDVDLSGILYKGSNFFVMCSSNYTIKGGEGSKKVLDYTSKKLRIFVVKIDKF